MAQRNPMNERYLGDGPQGKTRKSAAKLKPKTEAASSVHIDKKPQTKQERKAARKKRDKQIAAKEAERKRKAEEREKQARLEAGEEIEEPKKATLGSRVKDFIVPAPASTSPSAQSAAGKASTGQSATTPQRVLKPDSPEYKKWRRIYWILMGVGVAAIALSFLMNFYAPNLLDGYGMMVPMALAYAAVIGAIVIDYTKVRKFIKAHNKQQSGGRMSPKQQKHEQEKAEAAALLEESKKAQREQKRANSRLLVSRKSKEKSSAQMLEEAKEDLSDSDNVEEAAEVVAQEEADTSAENLAEDKD